MEAVSSLFALEAENLLAGGAADEALELCRKGIEHFPEYPVAFGVMARIYAQKGDFTKAIEVIEDATSRFPFYRRFSGLRKTFEESLMKMPSDAETENPATGDDFNEIRVLLEEEKCFLKLVQNFEAAETDGYELKASNLSLIPGIEFSPLHVKSKKHGSSNHIKSLPPFPQFSFQPSVEDDEDKPVPSVKQQAKSKLRSEHETVHQEKQVELTVITETMANIYVQQGATDAALKAYLELARLHPEKLEYFNLKAEELKKGKKI